MSSLIKLAMLITVLFNNATAIDKCNQAVIHPSKTKIVKRVSFKPNIELISNAAVDDANKTNKPLINLPATVIGKIMSWMLNIVINMPRFTR